MGTFCGLGHVNDYLLQNFIYHAFVYLSPFFYLFILIYLHLVFIHSFSGNKDFIFYKKDKKWWSSLTGATGRVGLPEASRALLPAACPTDSLCHWLRALGC